MVTHSSILVWEIPWTEEPPGLQSTVLQRIRHNLATKQLPHAFVSNFLQPSGLQAQNKCFMDLTSSIQ